MKAWFLAVAVFAATHVSQAVVNQPPPRTPVESYRDLITKARNLILQRDRAQASQVLQLALKRETRGSGPHRELVRTLDELMGMFLTEKGQHLFSLADAAVETKPREAIESYQAALRAEDGNTAVLVALARAYLLVGECDRADPMVKQAERVHPFSVEIRLLRLQVAECRNHPEQTAELLALTDVDLAPVETFVRGLQIKDVLRRNEVKKARTLLQSWEQAHPDYPEVFYWKWKMSMDQPDADRAAALKYVLLCQNLTPRKKKSFMLDLDLCKGKEKVESYLKDLGGSGQ